MVCGGFAERAIVSALVGAGFASGPFDDFANAASVFGGDSRGGVHVGVAAVGKRTGSVVGVAWREWEIWK